MVKFTHLISKEGENNKCYVLYVYLEVFKNSIKLSASLFLVMLQTFFTQRALKRKLGTQRSLQGHSKVTPRALEGNSGTRMGLEHSGTKALRHLRHFI